MRRELFLRIFIVHIFVFLFFSYSYALAPRTHNKINEYISRNTLNQFSLNLYLQNQIGIQGGIEADINSKQVYEWLGEGGEYEDEPPWTVPYLRSVNHFHNPLEPDIEEAGFTGIWGIGILSGESSILWSQKPVGEQSPGGYYSWHDVRGYFYTALTATDKATRDSNFAETFRGLGQLMHLVEDLSVPEHTRDDGHYLPAYEAWVNGNTNGIPNVIFKPETGEITIKGNPIAPVFYDMSGLRQVSEFPEAPVPIANLFDTNQYNDSNPITTLQSNIGLSEYTNANFLSSDTMFTDDFPFPKAEHCVIVLDTPPNGIPDLDRKYLSSTNGHPGEQINHLAVVSYLDHFRKVYFPNISSEQLPVSLDPACFEEYASKLIPRAVGYSAGLLDYFFRGAIEITLPDNGVYALTDLGPDVIDPTQQGFDRITLLAQNTTPEGEEMTGGTVTLVVKYKLGQGDQFQNPPATTSDEFYYIVKELEGTHSIPRDTPVLFEFDINASQIPLWATDVYINLVYKGNLGNEEGAIAVGFKDISEPTPINYYNVMDKICMDEQLFDSGSTTAIAYVDTDSNGVADPDEWDVYPHNAENIHIRFSPEGNPQAATSASSADNSYEKATLVPDDYFRLFILSDYRFNRSASVEYTKIVDEDQCDQFHGTFPRPVRAMDGIKNQTDLVDPVYCGYEPCYARLITGFHTTRGVVSFFSVLFDNASNPIDSICSYED